MILIDANLLLYAHVKDMPQHVVAHRWLEQQFNETPRVGLPWPSLLAFLRLVTNPRVFSRPESPQKAWQQVESWLSLDNVWIPGPTERHAKIFALLVEKCSPTANLISDTHLAALSIEHGLTLCSADGDFARFPGLNWKNPIYSV